MLSGNTNLEKISTRRLLTSVYFFTPSRKQQEMVLDITKTLTTTGNN